MPPSYTADVADMGGITGGNRWGNDAASGLVQAMLDSAHARMGLPNAQVKRSMDAQKNQDDGAWQDQRLPPVRPFAPPWGSRQRPTTFFFARSPQQPGT